MCSQVEGQQRPEILRGLLVLSLRGENGISSVTFRGRRPVYQYLQDEIVELVGAPVYELLVRQLRSRQKRTPLAHPAVRR